MTDDLVVGIGNPDRGDDGIGFRVAELLQPFALFQVDVVTHPGEAAGLMALFAGRRRVFIVDAARGGGAAGSIYRFDAVADVLPASVRSWSSHGFGVAEAVELARVLGQLPPLCIVYAIEGAGFVRGAGLSPPASAAAEQVAGRIVEELAGPVTTLAR